MFDKKADSTENPMVLTSRIRLARNIMNMPFPHMMTQEQADKIIYEVSECITDGNAAISKDFNLFKMRDLDPLNRNALFERHLVSQDLVNNYQRSGLLLDKSERVSIMINEEDHIRLQVLYPGFKIREAYDYAGKIDDLIEERMDYAFDTSLGYLTSCPTNVGTGIRASVMLHLPALTVTKNINNILNTVAQVGVTIRGIYGEGSNAMGNIYQISNQVTLGLSEDVILNNLIAVTKKIINQETMARNLLLEKQGFEMEDEIYRAFGILKYARKLTTTECLSLMSRVRMGIEMEIIKDMDINKIDRLLVNVQPATLQIMEKKVLETDERDAARARVVREVLK